MTYEIKVEKVKNSRIKEFDLQNIVFGRIFSDHMLTADFRDGKWQDVQIMPFQNLSLHPATTVLHYGQEIFEGLKAYKDQDGNACLFRPSENFVRLNASARRMCMPEVPEEIFMEGLRQLVALDKQWIPSAEGSSLYIRPFMIATDEYVGIKISDNYKFVIFCCPVNAYYPEPIKVKLERSFVRAAPGGTGEAKAGGNYAASLYANAQAGPLGYRQMLWTDAIEHKYIEESGTMNVFFVIENNIITPALNGSILRGITRDSVLTLLRDKGYQVEERRVAVDEIIEAHKQGLLKEVFGTGTAATIACITAIGLENGEEMALPPVNEWEVSNYLLETLDGIRRGRTPDKFNWVEKLETKVLA